MKKIKLVRIYSQNIYDSDEYKDDLIRLTEESEWLEVTDEEYELLTDYRVRDEIAQTRNMGYYDKLIMIEDITPSKQELIKSAKDILDKIKKDREDREKKYQAAEKKRKEKAEATKIARAKKILEKAGIKT